MVWTKGNPAARILANTLAGLIRDNNAALETAIGQDHNLATGGDQTGHHKQVTLNNLAGDHAGLASHLTIYNDAGVLKFRNGTGTVRKVSGDGDVIPAATKMWFFANTAPTGWIIDSSITDALIALKGGTPYATGGAGGVGDTWTQPGHTHTDPPTAAHTLLSGESGLPAHTHTLSGDGVLSNDESGSGKLTTGNTPGGGGDIVVPVNTAANAAGAHAHGSGGATSSSATANTWRPVAAVGIMATKDAY